MYNLIYSTYQNSLLAGFSDVELELFEYIINSTPEVMLAYKDKDNKLQLNHGYIVLLVLLTKALGPSRELILNTAHAKDLQRLYELADKTNSNSPEHLKGPSFKLLQLLAGDIWPDILELFTSEDEARSALYDKIDLVEAMVPIIRKRGTLDSLLTILNSYIPHHGLAADKDDPMKAYMKLNNENDLYGNRQLYKLLLHTKPAGYKIELLSREYPFYETAGPALITDSISPVMPWISNMSNGIYPYFGSPLQTPEITDVRVAGSGFGPQTLLVYFKNKHFEQLSATISAKGTYQTGGETYNVSLTPAVQVISARPPSLTPQNVIGIINNSFPINITITEVTVTIEPHNSGIAGDSRSASDTMDTSSLGLILAPGSIQEQENAYLTFQSDSPFFLNVYDNTKHWDGTLYYSTDLETWSEWDGTTTLSSVNNKLYLSGTGNTRITGDNHDYYRWVLTGSNIECIGNIENLLDWRAVALGNHPTMASYCYSYMFSGCTALVSAPDLPATTLARGCYYYMFYGCTALASAPALLPATTLASRCYQSMFSGCTALASAPALPATTLVDYCYYEMFKGCTALASAPALLPATTLADYCYYSMFRDCTALASAPALPATTLASYCYAYMFYECTALASAPALLPATTLADYCYYSMFRDCTALASAPALPATTLADHCYQDMFYGCSSLTSAPALPATTLAAYCYAGMFEECTALASVPALPATTLADSCYSSMFYRCTSLKISSDPIGDYQHEWRIPTSGTGTTAISWNLSMFSGTGGTYTGNPSINTTYYLENPPVV